MDFLIHFIGIGGVSMSGIAEYYLKKGFKVSGSDRKKSRYTDRLERLGVKIYEGHNADNLKDAQAVVYSDAINGENPELIYAKDNKLFIMDRATALNSICKNYNDVVGVCGCHGKTTTTCMLAHIFNSAKLNFTAHIGGEDLSFGNFVYKGDDLFLSEVCEFKKNLNKFTADYAVCLSTGVDHMDCYESIGELKNTYLSFIKRGYKSIICKNDEFLKDNVQNNSTSFSFCEDGDIFATRVKSKNGKYSFDCIIKGKKYGRIKLSVLGKYNILNALASISCAYEMGVKFKYIKKGLKNFKGVKRRFENIGYFCGAKVIADYAHHPTEIEETLKLCREVKKGKLFVVFQPHTYSRTIFLKDEFISVLKGVENLSLYKTFSARENYIYGGSACDLSKDLEKSEYFEDLASLLDSLKYKVKKGDLILILGAGDLYDEIIPKLKRK